jgi:type I restriction enzyme S subunit
MPEQLPKGWVKTKLGEVSLPVSTIQPEDSPDAEFTYFDIGGIDNERNRIAETKTVTGRNAPSRARQAVRKDDILFSTVRTYLRKIARVERDYPNPVASTGFTVIRAAEGVSSQFLFFQILSEDFLQPLHALQTGSSYPAVRDRDVFAQPIVLAPEREQNQIAAKLETALSRMANGEKAAHRARERLHRYRSAVLHAAVTGELTREWRETQRKDRKVELETGEALLQRLLAARRARWEETELRRLRSVGKAPKDDKWKSRYTEPVSRHTGHLPDIPKEWALATFDQITTLITKGSSPNWQGFNYCDEGIIFVRSENVRWGSLDLTEVAHLPAGFNEKQKRSILEEGDVLLNLVGASIGRATIATAVLWLISSVAQKRIHSEKVDFARANFSLANTRSLPIPIPSLAEQSLIVREVERRLSAADGLAAALEQQLARSATTRESLLREAFAGRLVPQNTNDEPASVLLERTRAEREAEAKRPRGKPMPKSRSKKKVSHSPLLDVLREHRKPMTPEQLFRKSGYEAAYNESDAPQDLVDAFYKELRKLTDKPAKVAERKDSGQQAWLRVLP